MPMVGGIVIEVVTFPDKVFVDCRDTKHRDTCAIYVEYDKQSKHIEIGDMFWWHAGAAYWTPADNCVSREERKRRNLEGGKHYDIRLKRIGYSGVKLERKEK